MASEPRVLMIPLDQTAMKGRAADFISTSFRYGAVPRDFEMPQHKNYATSGPPYPSAPKAVMHLSATEYEHTRKRILAMRDERLALAASANVSESPSQGATPSPQPLLLPSQVAREYHQQGRRRPEMCGSPPVTLGQYHEPVSLAALLRNDFETERRDEDIGRTVSLYDLGFRPANGCQR